MPLTDEQIVRSRINDPFRYDTEVVMGDGLSSAFKLKQGSPFSTISGGSFTASVTAAAGWSATGSTIDTAFGRLVFPTAIAPNNAIQCDYQWSVFSTDEMTYFLTLGGIPQACLGAVNHLLTNYAKRGRWAAPDGSTYDDTMAFNSLMALRSALLDEIRGAELGPLGDSVSWAETQQDFF